jgi:Tol biopolymer transport system component
MKKLLGTVILLLVILMAIAECGGGSGSLPSAPPPSGENFGKILFSSNRDGNYEIYVMDADGSNQKRLTNNPANDSEPAWSSDRKKIVFVSDRGGTEGKYKIYVMNADGTDQKLLPTSSIQNEGISGQELGPVWSSDGKYIAFASNRQDLDNTHYQLYVMSAEGSANPTSITSIEEDVSGCYPSWSPDGKIVYASGKGEAGFHLFIATPISGGGYSKSQLTEYLSAHPAWSPDGSKIAFHDCSGPGTSISVIDLKTNTKTKLYNMSSPYDCLEPIWSPDGTKIAFSCNISGTMQIYVMGLDGNNVTCLTEEGTINMGSSW